MLNPQGERNGRKKFEIFEEEEKQHEKMPEGAEENIACGV